MKVEIFICYARKDHPFLDELKRHLMLLQRQGHIVLWHDGDISAGKEWEREIKKYLDAAQIILLLISPNFMASDYCYGIEMQRAMERHNLGEARVIPIILRPVYWQGAPYGKLQALPLNAKPVIDKHWQSQDEAFYEITMGIQKVIEELRSLTDKKVLRKKYLEHQKALQEISLTGFDICPECGSTEFTMETHIDPSHDEIYEFKRCKECDNLWE
ncbi:MAG TPA: toll/interleukin-1 receptor domain-containing protein [Candidatus Acidoferrum sp.]|nr:toll/interleukin-1 receptor domain-containing protein [Candidatus Acidoferrum sp.]